MFAAFFLTTSPTFLFAQSRSSFEEIHSHRKKPKPTPTPPPTLDAERDWASTGTGFNTGANWVGGIAPGLGDVAWFKTAEAVQPNVSASLSIAGLYFQSTGSSGYDITRTSSAVLTLTGYATDVSGAENSNATAVAVGANNTSGTNTIDVPLTLAPASGSTSTFYQAGYFATGWGTLVVNGVISGSGIGLTKAGGGTLILTGANTYTGLTTITDGRLNIQNATALGTTAGGTTVSNGATLEIQGNITVGAEALTINGTGVNGVYEGALDNVSGGNHYGGLVTLGSDSTISVESGDLFLTNTGTITGAGFNLTLLSNTLGGVGNISSIIGTGTGGLTVTGGLWILSGASTYTGGTSINFADVRLSGAGTLGGSSGSLAMNQGYLDLNGVSLHVGNFTSDTSSKIVNDANTGAVTLTIGNGNGGGGNYAGVIADNDNNSPTGTIALTKTGTETITLSGANTYTGTTTISAGVLNIQNGSALGSTVGGTTVSSGATLQIQGGITVGAEALFISGNGASGAGALENFSGTNNYGGLLTLGAATTISSDAGTLNLTNTGTITGSGSTIDLVGPGNGSISSIIGTAAGNLIMNGPGTWILAGANTYTGGTIINGGTLALSGGGTLGSTNGTLTVNTGGTLDLNATFQGVGNLTGTGGTILNNGGGAVALTIGNGNGGGGTYAGVIADNNNATASTIALTKTGTGKITLTGANSYSGVTTIGNGTLSVATIGNSGSSSNLGSNGTINIGSTTTAGTLLYTGSGATSNKVINLNGTTGGSIIDQSGTGLLKFTSNLTATGAGAKTLTLQGSTIGTGELDGIIVDSGSGATAVTKTGTGTWTLLGANTYTGATTVSNGILNIQNAAALGATTTGTTVSSGATLQLQGGLTFNAEPLTISGTGETGQNGVLVNVSGTNNYGGLLTLGAASTISSDAGTLNLTNAGTITGAFALTLTGVGNGSILSVIGTGTGSVTKAGTGTWTLSGANTYTGATTVAAGILNIQNATALGTTAGDTTVSSGATLQLEGGITVGSGEGLTISGIGASGATGALESIDGNNYGGLVTLAAASTISSDAGALTLSGNVVNGGFLATFVGAGNVTASGVISGTGGLTMNGTGVLTLSGSSANTYSGTTTINSGELDLNKTAGLNALAGNITIGDGTGTDTLKLLATNQIANTSTLTLKSSGVFDLNSFAETIDGLSSSSSTSSVMLGSAALTVGANNGTSSFAGVISGTGGLTKSGTGTLTLSGASTYTGVTTIGDGTLSVATVGNSGSSSNLGSNGTINIGSTTTAGTLLYTGTGETSNKVINLNGTSGGATIDQSGTGLLKFTSNLTATVAGAKTLTLQGSTAGAGEIDGIVVDSSSGATALTKTGTGTWTLLGANTYTGATTISNGILNIQNATALGTTAAGTTVSSGATLQLQGGLTFDAEPLTINGTGETGQNGALVNVSGTNNFGGLLKLGATSTISSDAGTLNFTNTGIITGAFGLTLTGTGDGSIASIIGTGTGSVTKTGTGTWTLSGANTYSGAVLVSAGILNIQNATALGTTGGAATVSSGATLQIQGGITVGAQALTISGTGASGATGALENVSGINTYGGLVTLGAASTISSDLGTLNLTNAGTITGIGFGLTLTGAGDGSISSIIGTTTGTLTKSGSGTWTLNAANTYTGLTTVTAGTLAEGVSNALSTGALTVNGGTAIFDLGANHTDSVGIVTVDGGGAINGTGTSALTSTGTFEMKSGAVSAILAGSGIALNKTTAGTVTLSGANTYTGATTVNAGSLFVNGSIASGSAVTVSNSGTVLGGTGTIHGTVTINSGAAILGGDKTTGTTLTVASNLTLTSGSIIELALGPSLAHSTLARTGGTWSFQSNQSFTFIDLGATTGTYDNIITGLASNPGTEGGWTISNPGFVGTFTYDGTGNIDLTLTAVPEPSTWFGGALAFAALAFTQRRRFVRKPESSSSQLRHRQRLIGLTSYI